jgi:hypothetical protein
LLFLAAGAAAVVAFGTRPELAAWPYGVELILLSRRVQWPMLIGSIVLCLSLVGLIVAGRRRAWWLIGLAPVLALCVYRFSTSPANDFMVLENPPFVPAGQVDFLGDDDFVVGLVFEGKAYAYPFASLYAAPVIQQQDHDRRMLLMWSAFANRAQAWTLSGRGGGELRARDLEIISMPANALLLYNTRRGQFINGLTGLTGDGQKPAGLGEPIQAHKMRWRQWRGMHEQTMVLRPVPTAVEVLPPGPILPYYPVRNSVEAWGLTDEERVTIIMTDPPLAVLSDSIDHRPLNLRSGGVPLLVFRDAMTGQVRALDRRVEEDLSPQFRLNTDVRRGAAVFVDGDTNTGWSGEGVAVDGERSRRGRRLKAIVVDDDVYWGAVRFWYPQIQLHRPDTAVASN